MLINNDPSICVQSEIATAVQLWKRAAISLLDIRHNLISPDQPIRSYHLPASAFIFTSGGKAGVMLNDTAYNVERFGLFHGGKGTELTITPHCDWLETYMVLYKAGEPAFRRKEYAKLLEQSNPFRQQYGFAPGNPLFFADRLRRMYEKWTGATPLNLFYGKTAFYQLVYEIYEELERGNVDVLEPDIIAVAQSYLDKHYQDAITIQELCDSLGISHSHFHRSFKQQTGKSPQEYLIKTRLNAAVQALRDRDSSIREVAIHCGFPDEINFYRQFVKHIGVAPSAYKQNLQRELGDCAMENSLPFSYNWENRVSLGEPNEKGATNMFKQMRAKAILAAALSLMLLMSACTPSPTTTAAPQATPTAVAATQTTQPEATQPVEAATKIVRTEKGDVEVPVNPKRVIVQYLMGDLVALNVIPIGITEVHQGAAFESALAQSQSLSQWELEPEAVMALEPDLILLASDTQYEDMSKIAPTVLVPYGTMTMQERMAFLGEVLDRQDEANAALEKYQTAIADGKNKLAQAGLSEITISGMQVTDDAAFVVGDMHSLGTILYDGLGLKAPEAVQKDIIDAGEFWGAPSMELLTNYCGDYIFHMDEVPESVAANAVWQSIPAVSAGHVLVMKTALTYYADITSSTAMVNNVVEQLIAAKSK